MNSSCKSYGKPHPNCRCYGAEGNEYAKGGMISSFCYKDRPHNKDCEYFAHGGLSDFDSLKDDNETSQPLKFDDLQDDSEKSSGLKFDDLQDDNDKYGSTNQSIIAGGEGLARGYLSAPVTTGIEMGLNKLGVPGLTPEDIKGRQEANPIISHGAEAVGLGAGLLTGTGELGLVSKAVEAAIPAVESANFLAKAGSAALRGAIEMGMIQGGDEISKAMLGQPGGDHEAAVSAAVSNIGYAALAGGVTGGVFDILGQGATKGLQLLEKEKLGTRAANFTRGFGSVGNPHTDFISEELANNPAFKAGAKFRDETISKTITEIPTDIIGAKIGTVLGSPTTGGIIADKYFAPYMDKLIGRHITKKVQQYARPAALKVLQSGNFTAMAEALDYAAHVAKGNEAITDGIEGLFKGGTQQVVDLIASEKERQKTRQFIEQGGVDKQVENQMQQQNEVPQGLEARGVPQGFAKGGHVAPRPNAESPFSQVFPEQNMLLNGIKARVSGYLNSVRPIANQPKLPFDDEMPQTDKERSYKKAIDIANQPLSILNHINKGTLETEHMQHFTQMYPELYSHLKNKMGERIINSQLEDKKPGYMKRQSMSLFLASPLDSTMTPVAIQAIQNVFLQKQVQQQNQVQPAKGKKNKASLTKTSEGALTDDQARQKRLQKV